MTDKTKNYPKRRVFKHPALGAPYGKPPRDYRMLILGVYLGAMGTSILALIWDRFM